MEKHTNATIQKKERGKQHHRKEAGGKPAPPKRKSQRPPIHFASLIIWAGAAFYPHLLGMVLFSSIFPREWCCLSSVFVVLLILKRAARFHPLFGWRGAAFPSLHTYSLRLGGMPFHNFPCWVGLPPSHGWWCSCHSFFGWCSLLLHSCGGDFFFLTQEREQQSTIFLFCTEEPDRQLFLVAEKDFNQQSYL